MLPGYLALPIGRPPQFVQNVEDHDGRRRFHNSHELLDGVVGGLAFVGQAIPCLGRPCRPAIDSGMICAIVTW